jgi:hypothetical protein
VDNPTESTYLCFRGSWIEIHRAASSVNVHQRGKRVKGLSEKARADSRMFSEKGYKFKRNRMKTTPVARVRIESSIPL